jgi:CubicO group peptidase (beta-lactamase class C family)
LENQGSAFNIAEKKLKRIKLHNASIKNSGFSHAALFNAAFNLYSQTSKLFKNFPATSPEQQGMSSAVLDSLMLFVKNAGQNIHHLTIIRNNQTVIDADFYPYSSQYLHDIASVTKSITSLLIGISIDKGFIKDENEQILKYFPEIKTRTFAWIR